MSEFGCTVSVTSPRPAEPRTIPIAPSPVSTDPYGPARYQDLDAGFLAELGVEVRRFSLGVRGVRGMGNVIDAGAVPSSPLDRAKLWTVAVSLEYLVRVF